MSTSMFDDSYNNLEKKLMYRYLYTYMLKTYDAKFPPSPPSSVCCGAFRNWFSILTQGVSLSLAAVQHSSMYY
jgi:hypothetical protein